MELEKSSPLGYIFVMYLAVFRVCPIGTYAEDYSSMNGRFNGIRLQKIPRDSPSYPFDSTYQLLLKSKQHAENKAQYQFGSNIEDDLSNNQENRGRKRSSNLYFQSSRDLKAESGHLVSNDVYNGITYNEKYNYIQRPRYPFNCSNIHDIKIKKKIGHGVSKQTFLGDYQGQHVAVKMVTRHLRDVRECFEDLKKRKADTPQMKSKCFAIPTMKLMKEILLLEQINHPNLVQLLGYCVRSEESDSTDISEHGVVAVYEYGQRFVVDSLQLESWQLRLQQAIELANFLDYLENSPLGSLIVPDFKEGHFLFVDNSIKMIDLDDINNIEPQCGLQPKHQSDCEYDLKCQRAQCLGFNAKTNMKHMNRLLFKRLLFPLTFPDSIIKDIGQVNAELDSLNYSGRQLFYELKTLQTVAENVEHKQS
ncbi:hypothetical protein LOTGIDRAFT_158812 [Lottia gigantea]|uniref:Protein kinase domain-containing protein n=1 Tax=Lottia gigantea TaxID=225164 RepID=V4AYT6_LOTGI|nr:hypothetical protein LOTGIDRAFT_158812 [Lottia gigantea]ESO98861.1 hypothetical protein LOTGIDRAFT_158812 [Lottia gigantea]